MLKQFLTESPRKVPVYGEYDVVVAGGGVAGVAAALAAARVAHTRVCLVEKACALGGLATLGNIVVYEPLCDGNGRQVIGGIAEELLRLSVVDTPENVPELHLEPVPACWNPGGTTEERCQHRLRASFNPIFLMRHLELAVLKAKVKLLFDSRFAGVIKEGKAVRAVLLETKSGRIALKCRAVIDATGDADVCAAAGEKTVSEKLNSRNAWFYYSEGTTAVRQVAWSDDYRRTLFGGNPARLPVYRGDNVDSVTRMCLDNREAMLARLAERQKETDQRLYPLCAPTIPTCRMSRRLSARVTIRESDDHRWFESTVAMAGDWRRPGPIYCIPLEALAGGRTANLLAVGRCLSATGEAWDALRAIPVCAVTGEAAGVAAAMLAHDQTACRLADLEISSLQRALRRRHAILDEQLVK
ncbi:MAG: FAD-dependent oxidoreductase [Victivallales bacterium]|nr:FAD-dependent oxidoreductase [Victivallales bacterium]